MAIAATASLPAGTVPYGVWENCVLTVNPDRFQQAQWTNPVSWTYLALQHFDGTAPTWLLAAWLRRNGYADTDLDADRLTMSALLDGCGMFSVSRIPRAKK